MYIFTGAKHKESSLLLKYDPLLWTEKFLDSTSSYRFQSETVGILLGDLSQIKLEKFSIVSPLTLFFFKFGTQNCAWDSSPVFSLFTSFPHLYIINARTYIDKTSQKGICDRTVS